MTTRILLVDDHKLFLAGLSELIDKTPGMQVVATTADPARAVGLVGEYQPDVVFTDIAMPGIDGLRLTEKLLSEFPDLKVICLSMHADFQLIESMFKAGAAAYVLKDCELIELIEAIRKVTAGDTYMSVSVAEVVAASFRLQGSRFHKDNNVELTERELQVLVMLANGVTAKKIAGALGLSVKTIGSHREHLMKKLGIKSIAGLTKYAIRQGLASSD